MSAMANRLTKIGLTVRGIFGEGSGSGGCMFQISNRNTLGISEEEILKKLGDAVRQISESEQKARRSIQGDALERLTDHIKRSEGILKYAHMIDTSEFIRLFSDVRFGITLGIISGISYEQMGTLLVEAMPAMLMMSSENTPKGEVARDKARAQKIQSILNRTD